MKHFDCINYIHLDCEKGMCALDKVAVPIDGSGSGACPRFENAPKCGICRNFSKAADNGTQKDNGIGICRGFTMENWAYESCGAFACEKFESRDMET